VTERKALEDELRARAWHDALTGLANRALFSDRVEHALARSRRQSAPLAVLFLDLDEFKATNDTLGHPAGDALLKEVAGRLLRCVRPEDTVARFGGDEFAVLLEDSDREVAEQVTGRVMEQLAQPFRILDHELVLHASVGMALVHDPAVCADIPADSEELLANADAAMYRAKARGKGRYVIFEPVLRRAALERSSLLADLEVATRHDEFVLHYQPVVSLRTGSVVGFEALIRWNHPRRGLLPPSSFLPLADETGLAPSLGTRTLRQACHDATRLSEQAGHRLEMSVNMTCRQLQQPGLVEEVAAALAESGLDPVSLVIDVDEEATVEEDELFVRRLIAVRELGVRLAVDNFGQGSSSISRLRRLPVDRLKIDQSLVLVGAGGDRTVSQIVGSIIELSHALGLEALAEGVESAAQADQIIGLGCDLAQGFNWSRPEPVDDVARWLLGDRRAV
jgi:diguanylate cyclase (GGDEF)-like protein